MNNKKLLHGLMLASAPLSLYAEGAQEVDNDAVDHSVSLNAVDVTANRASDRTPVAYTNISKEELNRQNDGRDLPFLLELTPSLITTSDAGAGMGYTSLRIRGTEGARINVTLNGIPINNPESHNVYWVDMPDLASSLSSVQVQRGVGTSTNGAGAFGASINMTTDAPSELPYAELSGAYGSYNTQRECFRVGSGLIRGHWAFDAKLSHQATDGYIDRASSALWSYFGQAAYISRKTLVRLIAFGGKEQTYMAWDYASKEEMEQYGRRYNPCGKYTDTEGNTAYYDNQNDYYVQHHVQLHWAQTLNDRWTFNAALHYTRDDGYYEQYKKNRTLKEYGLSNYVDAAGNTVKKSDLVRLKYNENDFGGLTFALNYGDKNLKWTVGGAANSYQGDHYGQVAWVRNYIGSLNPLQKYYDNTGRKSDANIYTRADYGWNNGLSAFVDLQYRYIHYKIDGASDTYDYNIGAPQQLAVHRLWSFFNPKVGVNYQHGGNRWFASWSVAHKEPTRDNFTDGDATHAPSAEQLLDYELGYNYRNRHITVGANLYYMDYTDQLVATGELSDTGNALSVNVPDSYRCGVELSGEWRPTRWFDWALNATFSRSRIKNFVEYVYEDEWTNPIELAHGDTPISFSPDVVLHNAFRTHFAGWDAALNTQYVSKQYMDNSKSAETSLDAYCVSDLHVGYTFHHIAGIESLNIGCTIYNLFNEKYESNGYAGAGYSVAEDGTKSIYRYAGYAAQAPTHVMGTVTLKF